MADQTVYEAARLSGMSKRGFLRFCLLTTASLGQDSFCRYRAMKSLGSWESSCLSTR